MIYDKLELTAIYIDSFDFLDHKLKSTFLSYVDSGDELKVATSKMKQFLSEEDFSTLLNSANNDYLKDLIYSIEKENAVAVTKYSKTYPKYLNEIFCPPIVLYAKGNLNLLNSKNRFAIVGSRKCLSTDKKTAEYFAKELSNAGVTIITGIAEGCDSFAIKGAVNSGNIISVSAGGFDNVYPKENADLFSLVAKHGLCISEQRPSVKSMPYMYPYRNRIIAGVADGVLVVSAGLKSGTLHTVSHALDQGKDVFAIPHDIGSTSGEGCNNLIKSGAFLTDTPEDILSYFGIEKPKEKKIDLEGFERELYEIIKEEGSAHVDLLSLKTGKKMYELIATLSMLEIKGVIVKSAGNYYSTILSD